MIRSCHFNSTDITPEHLASSQNLSTNQQSVNRDDQPSLNTMTNVVKELREIIDKGGDSVPNEVLRIYINRIDDESKRITSIVVDSQNQQTTRFFIFFNTVLLLILMLGYAFMFYVIIKIRNSNVTSEWIIDNFRAKYELNTKSIQSALARLSTSGREPKQTDLPTHPGRTEDRKQAAVERNYNFHSPASLNNKKDYDASPLPFMVNLYNSQSEEVFKEKYGKNIRGFSVSNSTERRTDANIKPIFSVDSNPGLWGIEIGDGKIYVFPKKGMDLNSSLTVKSFAINEVYNWEGQPSNTYNIIEPATFHNYDNYWKIENKGELEFL